MLCSSLRARFKMPELGGPDIACSTFSRSTRAACECSLSVSDLPGGVLGQPVAEKAFRVEVLPASDSPRPQLLRWQGVGNVRPGRACDGSVHPKRLQKV